MPEVGIEASVEPDEQLGAGSLDTGQARAHPRAVEVDGLLAEDVLARRRAGFDVVRMGRRGGGDDDGVHLRVREHRLRVHRLRAVRVGHGFGRRPVDVHHAGELRPGVPHDALDVDLRDAPGPQQRDPVHPPVPRSFTHDPDSNPVRRSGIGTGFRQGRNHGGLGLGAGRRQMQRRPAVFVAGSEVCASLDQRLDDGRLGVIARRPM